MADSKLTALSEISVPALEDLLYTVDDPSGTPVSNKVSATRFLGHLNHVCQGRLTLESGVPISTSDQTGKTSVYFTPYNGNRVAVYDGTRWRMYTFSELTLALGTLTSGLNYDVFLYDNAGTLTLESLAWTNDTTRATALTLQDGVYVKTGATTRRYLGTFRTTATTTTEDSAAKRFVFNASNRVDRSLARNDSTTSWTYNSTTVRQARATAANQVEVVIGLAGPLVDLYLRVECAMDSSRAVTNSIGADSTTAHSSNQKSSWYAGITGDPVFQLVREIFVPAVGYHYYAWLESVANTNATTIYGGDRSGMQGTVDA